MSNPFPSEVNLVKLAPVVWSHADSPFLTNNRKWSQGSWHGRILIWSSRTVCPTNLLSPVTVPYAGRSELNIITVYQVVVVVVSPLIHWTWRWERRHTDSSHLEVKRQGAFTQRFPCKTTEIFQLDHRGIQKHQSVFTPLVYRVHFCWPYLGIWTGDPVVARRLITSFISTV